MSWNAEKNGRPAANVTSTRATSCAWAGLVAPCWSVTNAMGPASAMYPSDAGTTTNAVDRSPRPNRSRNPSWSAEDHFADIDGRSAVITETA